MVYYPKNYPHAIKAGTHTYASWVPMLIPHTVVDEVVVVLDKLEYAVKAIERWKDNPANDGLQFEIRAFR